MLKSNTLNTDCLFHYTNQWDEQLTRYYCTIYFAFINAKYNGVIKDFTEDEIKEVAEIQKEAGKLKPKGGKLEDWIYAVRDYLERKGIRCNILQTKDNTEVLNWFDRGYAIAHGILINNNLYYDSKDWVINTKNYAEFKGDQWHATNAIKWTERGENLNRTEEYILDSYFGKQSTGNYNSTYRCNFEEVIENIAMPTKYIIFK